MEDLAIIGAGAGGIAAAKHARKHGLSPVLVEKNPTAIGGTCLNQGCIPMKFLLRASGKKKCWEELVREKNRLVEGIRKPLTSFFNREGIKIEWGEADLIGPHTLKVNGRKIEAKNILIASGSSPQKIIDAKNTIVAELIFSQGSLPEKFLIVGGGSVGIEVATLLKNLNKDVSLIEKEAVILPAHDPYLSRRLKMIIEKKGIKVQTGKTLQEIDKSEFDWIVLATGRRPSAAGLNLKNLGIATDKNGWVTTDSFMRTNLENIYACGDVTGKKMLAYVAEYQGRLSVDNICGGKKKECYSGVPECVFSIPQMAKAGILEKEAKEKNIKYKVIKSNFLRFSSAHLYGDKDAFIEMLFDEKERIIGAGIISNLAAELISTLSLCIKSKTTLAELKRNLFVHPTLSEIIPLILQE